MNKVYTIGVIGFNADTFFGALQKAGVDTLIDIRRRRDVRGRDYAFANSLRLQARLAELGINYLHRLDLAPTKSMIEIQMDADHAAHVPTRQREVLSPAFAEAYKRDVLANFDPHALATELPADAVVALMCVERDPKACHRSLVAARLGKALGIEVAHLVPAD